MTEQTPWPMSKRTVLTGNLFMGFAIAHLAQASGLPLIPVAAGLLMVLMAAQIVNPPRREQ